MTKAQGKSSMKEETMLKKIARKVYGFVTACIMLMSIALGLFLVWGITGLLTGGSEFWMTVVGTGSINGIISAILPMMEFFDKLECKLLGSKW